LKKLTCFLSLFILVSTGCAQTYRKPVTAIYNNLNAYSQNNLDALSFNTNKAALAGMEVLSGGIYSERRFSLNELALYQAAIAIPTKSGSFGITSNYFGSSLNTELSLGLAYGRKLSEKIAIGAGFNYFMVAVQGYGNAAAYNFEAGLLFHVTEQFHAGLHAYNPTTASLGKGTEEFLPSIYTLGIGYEPSEKFFVAASLQKEEGEGVDFNAGIIYKFDKKLLARTGFAAANSTYYLGLGFQLASMRLDATASIHPHLGISPGLQLLFQRKKEKE
jgi:hypothetical protein